MNGNYQTNLLGRFL